MSNNWPSFSADWPWTFAFYMTYIFLVTADSSLLLLFHLFYMLLPLKKLQSKRDRTTWRGVENVGISNRFFKGTILGFGCYDRCEIFIQCSLQNSKSKIKISMSVSQPQPTRQAKFCSFKTLSRQHNIRRSWTLSRVSLTA